jgi:hypothetical protein
MKSTDGKPLAARECAVHVAEPRFYGRAGDTSHTAVTNSTTKLRKVLLISTLHCHAAIQF